MLTYNEVYIPYQSVYTYTSDVLTAIPHLKVILSLDCKIKFKVFDGNLEESLNKYYLRAHLPPPPHLYNVCHLSDMSEFFLDHRR